MCKEIKVCMLIYSFYPFETGASRQALTLARKIKQNGIDIFILTHGEKNLPIQEKVKDVAVFRVVLFGNRFIREITYIYKTILFLVLKNKKYDILHIHGAYWLNYGAILIGKIFKKSVIVKITQMGDDDPLSVRKKRLGMIQFFILSLSDYFIATVPAAIKSCEATGISVSRLIHIPNGVDTNRFSPETDSYKKLFFREALGLTRFKKIAIFVGIKTRRKGLDLLIDAWKSVLECYPDAALLLVGPSEGESEEFSIKFINFLKEKIDRYMIRNNVFLLGEVAEVENYLKASDIFIFPSRAEGFPSALIEAMACGLPCIVSRIKGVTDYIIDDGENGLIIEQENIEKISEAIKMIFNDANLSQTFTECARQKAVNYFSIGKIVFDYLALYKRIAKC